MHPLESGAATTCPVNQRDHQGYQGSVGYLCLACLPSNLWADPFTVVCVPSRQHSRKTPSQQETSKFCIAAAHTDGSRITHTKTRRGCSTSHVSGSSSAQRKLPSRISVHGVNISNSLLCLETSRHLVNYTEISVGLGSGLSCCAHLVVGGSALGTRMNGTCHVPRVGTVL